MRAASRAVQVAETLEVRRRLARQILMDTLVARRC
jgi:hypothetical protein